MQHMLKSGRGEGRLQPATAGTTTVGLRRAATTVGGAARGEGGVGGGGEAWGRQIRERVVTATATTRKAAMATTARTPGYVRAVHPYAETEWKEYVVLDI
uniref:Uncharacterized protein n=1 Tax=Oryza sativa subsp. japonica TaxID=39947 RepID=Q8W5Q2_ORYSJ|nr:hypothetical protein [Oryza sativa Japonica Group]